MAKKKPSMRRFLGDIHREIDKCVGEKPECILRVLDAASDAARETAQHFRSAWQEPGLARVWDRAAGHIDRAHAKVKRDLTEAGV